MSSTPAYRMFHLISKPLKLWTVVTCALLAQVATTGGLCLANPAADDGRAESQEILDRDVGFYTHIQPVLHRAGCNAIECHGSFQGKSGFRLSLNARKPEADLIAVLQRVDRSAPESSPLLRKPLGLDDHGGGQIIDSDSREAELLRHWLRSGVPKGTRWPEFELRLIADERQLSAGQQTSVRMILTAGDQQTDVTAVCRFHVQDQEVARFERIDGHDVFVAIQPGRATQLIGEYGNSVASLEMYVVSDSGPGHVPIAEETGPPPDSIDEFIARRHRRLGIEALPLCSDEVFVRRVSLDLVGRLPTVEEFYAFVESTDPDKRDKFIDEKLESDEFAMKWGSWLAELFGARPENASLMFAPASHIKISPTKFAVIWNYWFARRVAGDAPVSEVVRDILAATSRDGGTCEDYLRFREQAYVDDDSLSLSAAKKTQEFFLSTYAQGPVRESLAAILGESLFGVSLNCAQCHDHPSRDWTQADYEAIQTAFGDVHYDVAPRLSEAEKRSLILLGGLAGCAGLLFLAIGAAWLWRRRNAFFTALVIVTVMCMLVGSAAYLLASFSYLLLRVPESSYMSPGGRLLRFLGSESPVLQLANWQPLLMSSLTLATLLCVVLAFRLRARPRLALLAIGPVAAISTFGSCCLSDAVYLASPEAFGHSLAVDLRRQLFEPEAYSERDIWEVFVSAERGARRTSQAGEKVPAVSRPGELVDWILSEPERLFPRNIANRAWAELFGVGLRPAGEIGNPRVPGYCSELEEWLAGQLADDRWSLHGLVRSIVRSRVYQQASAFGPVARASESEYVGFPMRTLRGTVLTNCLAQAVAADFDFPLSVRDEPSTFLHAAYVRSDGGDGCAILKLLYPSSTQYQLPTLDTHVTLMVSPLVEKAIQKKAAALGGQALSDDQLHRVYVECLARRPNPSEIKVVRTRLQEADDASSVIADLLWALVNSDEFFFVR